MVTDLETVWAAIGRERELREDLATYQRNVYMRRVEPDEEHESRLCAEIDKAREVVDALVAERQELAGA